jgi:hypothetical protein
MMNQKNCMPVGDCFIPIIELKQVEVIMAGLLEKNPEPDKETDAMAWVRHMNLLKEMAEEVVVRELIYT